MKNNATPWLKKLTPKQQEYFWYSLAMKALSFACQMGCFWYFSALMSHYVTQVTPLLKTQLVYFISLGFMWVLFRHSSTLLLHRLKALIEVDLQTQLNTNLSTQQHALVKCHSSFFWQQLYLQYIPAIAQYKSIYTSQKTISVLFPIAVILVVFPMNWLVASILVVTLPIVPLFMILVGHGASKLHRKHFNSLERLGGLFIDRLKALTLLTSFSQHNIEAKRLSSASELVNKQTMRVVSVAFLSTTVLDFFSTVAMALVAVYIGFSLLGEIAIGPLISFHQGLFLLLVTPLLFSELKVLGSLYHQKGECDVAVDAFYPLLTSSTSFKASSTFKPFKVIHFALHSPDIKAQKLSLNKHDSIQLTGQSGSGKTATLEALMGLKNSSHKLSGRCVLFTQQAILILGSIRENLLMGQSLKDSQLWEMLNSVHLQEKILSLPQQLDTILTENMIFSGGEVQRLALARVLLQPYDVILLDEPTAHLTDKGHRQLADLIHHLTEHKTRIWASHKALPQHWFNRQWHIAEGEITCH